LGFSAWTDADKASWGVTFEADADTSYDSTFYFAKDIPKVLGDTLWVDDDGEAVIDTMTGSQGVTAGLKTNWIAQTKQQVTVSLHQLIGTLQESLKLILQYHLQLLHTDQQLELQLEQ
jgi:hypothetical protein